MLKLYSPDRIRDRKEIPLLLDQLDLRGWGVEIGVKSGLYSQSILQDSRLARLFSIDPWVNNSSDYITSVELLSEHGSRSVVWRMTSQEAVSFFDDGSLDFVYIDANHEYDSVKQDISLWWPKVKEGGLLCGHDYSTRFPGVVQAVDEFVNSQRVVRYLTDLDFIFDNDEIRSWLIPKPTH